MLFKRKGTLKKQYDQLLLSQIETMRTKWKNEKHIWDKSLDINNELSQKVRLAELKYFYLLKEARARNLTLSNKRK